MKGYEPLYRGLRDRLVAQLPARLDAIAAEWGDGIPLPVPAAFRPYGSAEEAAYPVGLILPGQATPREQTGNWLTSVRVLSVFVEHREQTAERLALALMRYERAFLEAALGQFAPPPAHAIRWAETFPGPLFEIGDDGSPQWQSWMRLDFELTTYEEDR